MFHIIEKEMEWRHNRGLAPGFEALMASKPLMAVGAEEPLTGEKMLADYFHGKDGLGNVHTSHPHLTPAQGWESLFSPLPASVEELEAAARRHSSFIASTKPAYEEMLRLLRENDPGTITIIALGPLTNLALAAAEDPETFLRVKEVVVMGGAVDCPGNSRDRIASTVPTRSPLVEWTSAILEHSFAKLDAMHPGHEGDMAALSLHDPVCIWYALLPDSWQWMLSLDSPLDLRVETTGQWTRGMCVVDRRNRKRRDHDDPDVEDNGLWLANRSGNRVDWVVGTPGPDMFAGYVMDRLFVKHQN
ncbi:hypothetical protein CIHG_09567 [Coccidioides immitis H538.4]|uniref:Inosine/uridine-preferring nucleoside hydrolase domain-containing protein n=1 Tax=Coccidioides immitis H538.4 TaxID=396776 RepID=A0A0J8S3U8_COCIT|nr:hypothetical protein CIHG_09567 [Coccidioides immitis H538.4]